MSIKKVGLINTIFIHVRDSFNYLETDQISVGDHRSASESSIIESDRK